MTEPTDEDIATAVDYSERLLNAAIDVVAGFKIDIGPEWARNPKVVAVTVLCRGISNFRAAMVLVKNQQVAEARAMLRLLSEDLLWIGALRERGAPFMNEMIDDDAHNRKALGQITLELSHKHGASLETEGALELRGFIRDLAKQFRKTKRIHAADAAAQSPVELAYVDYLYFSLDGVHCSITALGKHLDRTKEDNTYYLTATIIPRTSNQEILLTIDHACRGLMGIAVGANEIAGPVQTSGPVFQTLLSEFEHRGWTRASASS
jgi:hypothetical protein